MAGGLKLNQLETIENLKDTDLMLVDSAIGTGKITIEDLRDYFNITQIQKDVDNINDSFITITTNLNETMTKVAALEVKDGELMGLINGLTSKTDTIAGNVKNLSDNKQDKTDNTLATTNKTVVGGINECNTNILNLTNNKQNKTDGALKTEDKTIVGSINEVLGSIPEIVNNLTDGGYNKTLSAEQGRELNETDKELEAKINEIAISVKSFGAYGDAVPRSIKSVEPELELTEVQKLNPDATLDDEYDWYIIQKCIKENNKVFIPEGTYKISKPLIIVDDNKEIIFERNATLSILKGNTIAAIQIGSSLEATDPKASNCIIRNPKIEGNGVGTGIECRYCGINNLIEGPIISNVERGFNFRVKGGFRYSIIRNVSIRNCAIGFDDTFAAFSNSILEGGLIENNNMTGLISASWGCQILGVTIAGNKGTEVKPIGDRCQLTFTSCTLHHNNESEAENDTNTIVLFDQNFKGILNFNSCVFTEQGHGNIFKENVSPIASADIYVTGGSFAVYQIFNAHNSPGIRAILNCKYNAGGDMLPIRTGVHKNAVIQTSDSEGEFASIHTSSLNLEPLDSETGAAAIRFTCSNYVPWSVGATGVGELKGSMHLDVSTSILYIRVLEAVGTDQVNNWNVVFSPK